MGRQNVCFVHVTLVPYLDSVGELKSKTTQHSVNELRRIGIEPDVLVLRSDRPLTDDIRQKIALYGGIPLDAVISAVDARDIYEVPLNLEAEGFARVVCERLGRETPPPDLNDWRRLSTASTRCEGRVRIALVGKYVPAPRRLPLRGRGPEARLLPSRVELDIDWVNAESHDLQERLARADGVLVPGGFGGRGIEGKIEAARHARENEVPYLGICLGMQIAVIEFARHVCGMDGANSTEFDPRRPTRPSTSCPSSATSRSAGAPCGSAPIRCISSPGTRARAAYGDQDVIYERHRHRYEVNPSMHEQLERGRASVFSGRSPNGRLVEVVELPDHPWFCASQFHPEFKSRPTRPQPLFREFVGAAAALARARGRSQEREPAPLGG